MDAPLRHAARSSRLVLIYIVYPMAPPWMASRDGYLGEVHRITSRGWSEIDLHRQTMVLFGMGNKVRRDAVPARRHRVPASPSASSRGCARPWRWLVLLYPLAMSLALVYFGRALRHRRASPARCSRPVVMVGCRLWEDRRTPTPP